MIKKNNWFTFIELLVVSSILIIISTSSVFYFFWFIDQTNLNSWIDMLKEDILSLDKNFYVWLWEYFKFKKYFGI